MTGPGIGNTKGRETDNTTGTQTGPGKTNTEGNTIGVQTGPETGNSAGTPTGTDSIVGIQTGPKIGNTEGTQTDPGRDSTQIVQTGTGTMNTTGAGPETGDTTGALIGPRTGNIRAMKSLQVGKTTKAGTDLRVMTGPGIDREAGTTIKLGTVASPGIAGAGQVTDKTQKTRASCRRGAKRTASAFGEDTNGP